MKFKQDAANWVVLITERLACMYWACEGSFSKRLLLMSINLATVFYQSCLRLIIIDLKRENRKLSGGCSGESPFSKVFRFVGKLTCRKWGPKVATGTDMGSPAANRTDVKRNLTNRTIWHRFIIPTTIIDLSKFDSGVFYKLLGRSSIFREFVFKLEDGCLALGVFFLKRHIFFGDSLEIIDQHINPDLLGSGDLETSDEINYGVEIHEQIPLFVDYCEDFSILHRYQKNLTVARRIIKSYPDTRMKYKIPCSYRVMDLTSDCSTKQNKGGKAKC